MPAKIDRTLVLQAIEDALNKVKTREEIAAWAYSLMSAEDRGDLEYVPKTDEPLLWTTLKRLAGIDIQENPSVYLHGEDDLRAWMNELK